MKPIAAISSLPIFLLVFVFQITDSRTVELRNLNEPCEGVEIVSRAEWKARTAWSYRIMKTPLNAVIIEHTVNEECYTKLQCSRRIRGMQEDHMDYRGWRDLGYNFLIGGDGRAYEANGWTRTGAHAVNFNTNSIGMAFIGNFMDAVPNQKMIDAALNLIQCGIQKGYLTPTLKVHGHRDVICTKSPGDKLYAIIRKWKNYTGGRLRNYNC